VPDEKIMTPKHIQLARLLTYAGVLPFAGAGALAFWGQLHLAERLALSYGAVIASFLAGIHWAVYMQHGERCPRNLFIASNITALLVFASLLLENIKVALLLQVLCFLYLLTLDLKLHLAGLWPEWFYRLRLVATALVVLALIGVMVA
jgi:hypothetical protein